MRHREAICEPPDSGRRRAWRLPRAAPTLVLALLAAACGSYTKADFTARADAICASSLRQLRSLAPPSFGSGEVQQRLSLDAYLERALPIVSSEASALRALRRPPGDPHQRAELDRYMQALARNVADYRQLARAAAAGDVSALVRAEHALERDDVDSLAAAYGILSCGAPGATIT